MKQWFHLTYDIMKNYPFNWGGLKDNAGLDRIYSVMSHVLTVSFVCDLNQQKNYYLSAFSYILRASCHHLRRMLHLDDMFVKDCRWVPAIHARVCR